MSWLYTTFGICLEQLISVWRTVICHKVLHFSTFSFWTKYFKGLNKSCIMIIMHEKDSLSNKATYTFTTTCHNYKYSPSTSLPWVCKEWPAFIYQSGWDAFIWDRTLFLIPRSLTRFTKSYQQVKLYGIGNVVEMCTGLNLTCQLFPFPEPSLATSLYWFLLEIFEYQRWYESLPLSFWTQTGLPDR